MTLHTALHTGSTAHAVLSALDGRLALSGLLALNGASALDVRLGVMYGPGTFAVTGDTSTGPWRYTVPAATFVTSKGALDGARIGTNDGPYLVSTIAPPASNSRYDVVYVLQMDADATISPDASTAPVIAVYNGAASATPNLAAAIAAIPVGACAIAAGLVLSTATGGTSGAGVTITQQFLWTTTRNDPIPVRNATEQGTLTQYDGLQVYRLDTHQLGTSDGTAWVLVSRSVTVSYTGGPVPYGLGPTVVQTASAVTGDGARKFKITFSYYGVASSAVGDIFELRIVCNGTAKGAFSTPVLTGAYIDGRSLTIVDVPPVGSAVYTVTAARNSGSGNLSFYSATIAPQQLIVEPVA